MTGYIFEHNGQQFTPDGRVTVDNVDEHNATLERAELEHWQTRPERFAAYVVNNQVTTWRGVSLGTIVRSNTCRNRLTGTRMRSVTVRGNNGATYSGRYGCDWSQLVRLRRAK